jgi:anthranilate phosphoribosyltransferase
MPDDPAGTADILIAAMSGIGTDEAKVISTLTAITAADLRLRVAACYERETGRKLKDDLMKSLGASEQKKVPEWLK